MNNKRERPVAEQEAPRPYISRGRRLVPDRQVNLPVIGVLLIVVVIAVPSVYLLHAALLPRIAHVYLVRARYWMGEADKLRKESEQEQASGLAAANDAMRLWVQELRHDTLSKKKGRNSLADAVDPRMQKARASLAEAEGKMAESAQKRRTACDHFHSYLNLAGRDGDVWAEYALAFEAASKGNAEKSEAVRHFDRAVALAGESDVRLNLLGREADLLRSLGRYQTAEEMATNVLLKRPADWRGWKVKALAMERRIGKKCIRVPADAGAVAVREVLDVYSDHPYITPADVGRIYGEARKRAPKLATDLEFVTRYAEWSQKAEGGTGRVCEKAKAALDELVAESGNARSWGDALMRRYEFYERYDPDQCDGLLAELLDAVPYRRDVMLAAARLQSTKLDDLPRLSVSESPEFQQAVAYYEKAIEIAPGRREPYIDLGQLYARYDLQDQAIAWWQRALRQFGDDDFQINAILVDYLAGWGRIDELMGTVSGEQRTGVSGLLAKLDSAEARLKQSAWLSAEQRLELATVSSMLHARALLVRSDSSSGAVRSELCAKAVDMLEEALASQESLGRLADDASREVRLHLLLAEALSRAGRLAEAATECDRAAGADSKDIATRVKAAAAWLRAGEIARAVKRCEELLPLLDPDRDTALFAETWETLALARYQLALQADENQRGAKWTEANVTVRRALRSNPGSWQLLLLRAELELQVGSGAGTSQQTRRDAALKWLKQAETEHPDDAGLMQSLVRAYQHLGCSADADRALETFDRIVGQDSAKAVAAHAALLVQRNDPGTAESLLADAIKASPTADQQQGLRRQLIQLLKRRGAYREAAVEMEKMCAASPEDPALISDTLDCLRQASLLAEDDAQSDRERRIRYEQKLEEIEKSGKIDPSTRQAADSLLAFHKAMRLLDESESGDDERVVEAARLQARLARQRPNWPGTYCLKAVVEEKWSDPAAATDALEFAIRLGDRSLPVVTRLVALLEDQGRLAEASEYIQMFQNQVSKSRAMTLLAIRAAAGSDDLQKALHVARARLAADPDDVDAIATCAQILEFMGDRDAAETMLRDAVAKFPQERVVWNGLFSFLIRAKRRDEAQEILTNLADVSGASAVAREYTLAQGYELLGDQKRAEQHYRSAAASAPDNVKIHERLARLLLNTDIKEAERLLREVMDQSHTARQALAEVLARRGTEKDWMEIKTLFKGDAHDLDADDRRLYAALLARRGRAEDRREAKSLLETLTKNRDQARAGDLVKLAVLYERDGVMDRAQRTYLAALSVKNPNPLYIVSYIDFLLRNHDGKDKHLEEAKDWLERLRELAPSNLDTLRVTTEWLKASGQTDRIVATVDKYVAADSSSKQDDPQALSLLWTRIGHLYDRLAMYEQAAAQYTRAKEHQPGVWQFLAQDQARLGRHLEAVETCLQSQASDHDAAQWTAIILTIGQPAPRAVEAARAAFQKAESEFGDDTGLLISIGTFYQLHGDENDAQRVYRKVLAVQKNNVFALNNLAMLLAERKSRNGKALELIEQAMPLSDDPQLLDTKGMVLLLGDNIEAALPLFKRAVEDNPDSAAYRFHWALALHKSGRTDEAARQLHEALSRDLDNESLSPADRRRLTNLRAVYK